jgi:hypothetical protein
VEIFWYLVVMWCLYGVSRLLFSMVDDQGAEEDLFRDTILRIWRILLCVLTIVMVLLKWA